MSAARGWQWAARRVVALAASLLVLGGGLAACSSGPAGRSATAYFTDANDLVSGAQVQLADIPIGHITGVSLAGVDAKVSMVFNGGVTVPDNVTAELDRTTILGERFVLLVVPKGDNAQTPSLANGATIAKTSVLPDVEQLIGSGAEVFGAVNASALEQIIAAGGEGFVGQSASLQQFLNDLSTVTTAYAAHTQQITTAINSLNQLSTSLAPDSNPDAQALTNLSQTAAILAQQSTQFNSLIEALNNLSIQGRSLLESYFPQITDQLHALAIVSNQLAAHQSDLIGILNELPVHDKNVSGAVRNDYVQILENLIICGAPGLGEDDTTTAFTCSPTAGATLANGGH